MSCLAYATPSEYLETVSHIILESGGVVDKYIGDIAMAFWNAPMPVPQHQAVACTVALNAQRRLQFIAKGTNLAPAHGGLCPRRVCACPPTNMFLATIKLIFFGGATQIGD